jgi:adenylate cyclase class 2
LTEEGDKLKLTSLDSNNQETKLFVSRKEECISLLSTLGYKLISEVEAHRTSYELGTIDFDIDEFPGIPAFLEIDMGEKATMPIETLITKLQLDSNKSGQMSTPEILNFYGKDYFEVYRKI